MNFFKKIFGSDNPENLDARGLIESVAKGLIKAGGFELDVTVTQETKGDQQYISVEFFGKDEGLLCQKDGQILDALQIFLKRVLQNRMPDKDMNIVVDAAGFSEENQKELEALADRLRNAVLTRKKPVYCRALPPKDRRIIHQYLSSDHRIRTRSIGEGTFKKIKIFLANQSDEPNYQTSRT
ncbi:MAG: hypothetical protein NZ480_06250 [Bdellovibrionaceae bacterium]|nr:hypothetical protein [Pseudobdellovibrionaceae bacterium]MDW8189349.1 R3H domain-containing nucleic acid-binding protein [Pseudobdellovibrionaceae bacterium]